MRPNRKRTRGRGRRKSLPYLLGLLVLGAVALVTLRAGSPVQLTLEADRPGIGSRTRVSLAAQTDGRGLEGLRLELVQGSHVELLAERLHQPRAAWAFWGPRSRQDQLEVEVGRATGSGLQEGQAVLRATATRAATWLLSPEPSVEELRLPVSFTPPTLVVDSTHNYVSQGGAAVVVYQVGESSVRDGVHAGDWWFPGMPLPESGPGVRFSLFAAPYDQAEASAIQLQAEDALGNQTRLSFVDRYFERPIREATINLSEGFMAKVVPEILSQTPEQSDRGGLLDNYLAINGELRQKNAEGLERLTATSSPRFLWTRGFLPLRGGQVMSGFADRRTYVFEGNAVDEQTHLGYDLASTKRAPVPASNTGTVVLARYYGIYGNTVVVDHGYGLMTLYAHLSSIAVKEGQSVERGQELGRTGQTGLAGGDHLHFSVMLRGHQVDPVEWWDARWIRDRIAPKLPGVLAFEG